MTELETSFAGRVAVVTGGAVGFGRAFGEALAERGATVVLADVDAERNEATASELAGRDLDVHAVGCDVADERGVDAVFDEVAHRHGGFDILINNAGLHLTHYNQPFSVLPRADLRKLWDVNVMGVINCSLAARRHMAPRGAGVIVNLASNAANLSVSPYGISKLAVRGLTVALAAEFAPDKIRVNAISPGLMGTENALTDLDPELMDTITNRLQLVKRIGTVDDIVATMLFLVGTHGGSFMTGETIRVCGGWPLYQ